MASVVTDRVTGVPAPSTATDRVTGGNPGVAVKTPCVTATSANIALTGLQIIGSVVLADLDRVLVKDQTDATENGIYNASTGAWTRAKDFNDSRDVVKGTRVYVHSGSGVGEYEVTSDDPIVVGTDDIDIELSSGVSNTVSSVFGRVGSVTAATSDYDASQIDNDSGVSGTRVSNALDTLNAGKAALAHTHAYADLTSKPTTVSGFGLTDAYTESEVDALLAGKSDTGHTHASTDITDFAEAVDDRVGTLMVAGTGITITYDDSGGSLTVEISAAAGALDGLSDVNAPTPSDGDVLTWDNGAGEWIAAAAPGAGSGAPDSAEYIVLSTNVTLTQERVLTAGTGVSLTDGGAGSTLTLAISDAELLALAGLTSAANKMPYFTGSGTAALADFTAYGRSIAAVADEAAFKTLVNLEIGTDVQAFDAELSALAGVTSAADKVPYFTGAGTAAVADFPTFGRSLAAQTSASGARSVLVVPTTSQTEYLSFLIETPSDKSYTIALKIPHGGTITETTTKAASGTCTATFKINTTALGGTANSVSSSEQSQSHASANVFSADDDLVVTVSSNSSCADFAGRIKYTRVLA